MSSQLTEDQATLQSTLRRFLQNEAPRTKIRSQFDNPDGLDEQYWGRLAELGVTAMLVPEEFGGGSVTEAPLADLSALAEEFGRAVAAGPFAGSNVVADALARSAGSFADVLGGLAEGGLTAAWAVAEGVNWGSSAFTTEVVTRDGKRLLSGQKDWVESAGSVDHLLVTARDGDGLIHILLDKDAVGLKITPLQSLDFVRRFSTVEFNDVEVPDEIIVSSGEAAAVAAERQLQVAVALLAAETVGAVEEVYNMVLEYVQTRVAFGRPIGSYQALKHRLAEHKLWLEAGFGLAAGLAAAVAAEHPDAAELTSVAKAHVSQLGVDVLQDCVQMFGGIGLTWEHDAHLFLRRASVNYSLYGTPADHRERLCVLAGL